MDEFAPTHLVPADGLDARTAPDPTLPAVARLDAGLPLLVDERAGDWAHIVCSNGWVGWVDGRVLVEQAGAPGAGDDTASDEADDADDGARATGARVRGPWPIVASVAAVVGVAAAFLAWVTPESDDAVNAFDVPAEFLVDNGKLLSGGFGIGLIVVALALVGGVLVWFPRLHALRRLCGVLLVIVAGLTIFNLSQFLSDLPGDAPSLTSTVGIGVYLTLLAGLVLAIAPVGAVQSAADASEVAPGWGPELDARGDGAAASLDADADAVGGAVLTDEVAAAAAATGLAAGAAATSDPEPDPEPEPEPEPASEPEPEPEVSELAAAAAVAAAGTTPDPEPVVEVPVASEPVVVEPDVTEPEPAPAPAAPSAPAPGPWTASHIVGGFGAPAWSRPDPALPVVTELAPGVELQVLQRAGGWVFVRAENGWTAWVDEARLVAR